MCSEICTHSDPLLAGLCIGTRRVLDRVVVAESYRLVENRSYYLDCVIQRDASCKTRSSCHHVFEQRAFARVQKFQLRASSFVCSQTEVAKAALISIGEPWCGSAASAGQGDGLGSQRNWASRFGEVKVGCKRCQSASCMGALAACTNGRRS